MIGEYCERHVPGLFEEPFNTISNLVFIWAAVQAWNLAGRNRVRTWDLRLLISLSATVGVGSAIWHMFATPWVKLADLIPILLFQLWFLWHLFNGALFYCAMRAIILKRVSRSAARLA